MGYGCSLVGDDCCVCDEFAAAIWDVSSRPPGVGDVDRLPPDRWHGPILGSVCLPGRLFVYEIHLWAISKGEAEFPNPS